MTLPEAQAGCTLLLVSWLFSWGVDTNPEPSSLFLINYEAKAILLFHRAWCCLLDWHWGWAPTPLIPGGRTSQMATGRDMLKHWSPGQETRHHTSVTLVGVPMSLKADKMQELKMEAGSTQTKAGSSWGHTERRRDDPMKTQEKNSIYMHRSNFRRCHPYPT